jgi:hypothetical protein
LQPGCSARFTIPLMKQRPISRVYGVSSTPRQSAIQWSSRSVLSQASALITSATGWNLCTLAAICTPARSVPVAFTISR